MAAMITDLLIILLLIGGIGYGIMISRRVQRLMTSLQELEPLVRAFSEAVDKSETSVAALRQNLDARQAATTEATPEEPAAAPDAEPAFASRRHATEPARPRLPGVQVVRNKQDLVRRFFETSRTESRA
ncbi:flagellar motor switch protein [Pseudodonghicola flavimaris]|uniref:Flagellar motor switch protein n=1 Tax=Pseudodonghicola flavimaris TaxID=3050036 RepID=A0ABT7EWI1_9RHOB|nr:flagellar motor switch protein [Pseudodonghicola flavimaris]MDK3016704.1 flagellar motor switch protein [Pseudodonghicola flavimaris]